MKIFYSHIFEFDTRYPSPRPPNLNLTPERKGSAGILRLDGSFARRRSSASGEPIVSPSPSADRLSVTFKMDDTPEEANNANDEGKIASVCQGVPMIGKVEQVDKEIVDNDGPEALAASVAAIESADEEYTDSLMEIARYE